MSLRNPVRSRFLASFLASFLPSLLPSLLVVVLALGGGPATIGAATAQELPTPRIMVIDLNYVMTNSTAMQGIQNQVDEAESALESQMQEQESELRTQDEALSQQRGELSDQDFENRRRQLEEEFGQYQRQFAERLEGMDETYAEAVGEVEVELLRIADVLHAVGAGVLDHLQRLYGEADDPLPWYAPPDRFDARIEMGYEVESHMALLFPLRRMIGDLCTALSIRDGGVQRFELRLEHEQGHTTVDVGLLAPERDPALLFEVARSRLERVEVTRPVVALRLHAASLPPFVPASRDLFDQRLQQGTPWPQLRERLRGRRGSRQHRMQRTVRGAAFPADRRNVPPEPE